MCWDPTLDHKQYVLELVGDILNHVRDFEKKDKRRKSPMKSKHSGRMEGRHFPEKIGLVEGGRERQTKVFTQHQTMQYKLPFSVVVDVHLGTNQWHFVLTPASGSITQSTWQVRTPYTAGKSAARQL